MKDRETVSLDEELKLLLLNYNRDDVDYFKEIMKKADGYQAKNIWTCNIITQEEGSNG